MARRWPRLWRDLFAERMAIMSEYTDAPEHLSDSRCAAEDTVNAAKAEGVTLVIRWPWLVNSSNCVQTAEPSVSFMMTSNSISALPALPAKELPCMIASVFGFKVARLSNIGRVLLVYGM